MNDFDRGGRMFESYAALNELKGKGDISDTAYEGINNAINNINKVFPNDKGDVLIEGISGALEDISAVPDNPVGMTKDAAAGKLLAGLGEIASPEGVSIDDASAPGFFEQLWNGFADGLNTINNWARENVPLVATVEDKLSEAFGHVTENIGEIGRSLEDNTNIFESISDIARGTIATGLEYTADMAATIGSAGAEFIGKAVGIVDEDAGARFTETAQTAINNAQEALGEAVTANIDGKITPQEQKLMNANEGNREEALVNELRENAEQAEKLNSEELEKTRQQVADKFTDGYANDISKVADKLTNVADDIPRGEGSMLDSYLSEITGQIQQFANTGLVPDSPGRSGNGASIEVAAMQGDYNHLKVTYPGENGQRMSTVVDRDSFDVSDSSKFGGQDVSNVAYVDIKGETHCFDISKVDCFNADVAKLADMGLTDKMESPELLGKITKDLDLASKDTKEFVGKMTGER